MMKQLALSFGILALIGGPLSAQTSPPSPTTPGSAPGATGSTNSAGMTGTKTKAECETMWRTVDKNSDGRLDRTEIDASKTSVPTALVTASAASQQEYMAACSGQR